MSGAYIPEAKGGPPFCFPLRSSCVCRSDVLLTGALATGCVSADLIALGPEGTGQLGSLVPFLLLGSVELQTLLSADT